MMENINGKLNLKDYKPLFRFGSLITIPCLNAEYLLKSSLSRGDPIVLFKDNAWHSFINIIKEQDCLNHGLDIFSDKDKYAQYSDEFRKYIEHANKNIIPKYNKPRKVSKQEIISDLAEIHELWYFYGLTEFSFHDLAYLRMKETGNPILENNLEDLGRLKIEGRKVLNAFIFKNGVIDNLLNSISLTLGIDYDDLHFMYERELISLFDKKGYDKDKIDMRKKTFGVSIIGNHYSEMDPKEVITSLSVLYQVDESKPLKGMIANKGIARGKVAIAEMMADPEAIRKVHEKMNKGDILVAHTTSPELMSLCHLASAIVTDQGGMLSHAAVISRELNKPCIVATENATLLLKDGDFVEVDANNGIVRKIK